MENYGPRYPYPYPQYPYQPSYQYPPAPYRPPGPGSEQYQHPPPPPYYPYPPPPPYAPPPYASPPPLHQHASGSHSGPLDYPPRSSSPEYHRHSFDYQPSPYPSPYPPHPQGTYAPPPPPPPHYPYQEPPRYAPPETKPQDPPPPPPSKTQAFPEYRRQDCLTSVPNDNVSNSAPSYDELLGGLRISDKPQLSSYPSNSWLSRPADLYGYPNSSFPSNSHLPILDRVDSSSSGYASSESPHGVDMRMTLFGKGSLKVLLLHGNFDIWIYHAKNLPNMDMFHKTLGDVFGGQLNRKITSDPYVSVSVAGAVIGRTYVMSNSENPVWMQHFYVPVAHHAAEVHFVVKDSDVVGSQLIGLVTIPVEQIYSGAKIEGTFPILSSNGKPCKPGANLSLSIQYTPMEKLSVYHHGVGAGPDYQGVPGTYFPLRKGGTVTLYQDAHVPEGMLPGIRLDNGMSYQHGKCWHDMFDAIRQARRLIYITGWSVWHKVRLVRDKVGPASACTLGELLRSKSQEGVRVLLLVWDDPTSRSILGYKTDGVMATHDEETRRFFKHSSVQVLLCPRNAGKRHSWVKQREVGTIYTHHQKNVIVDADAGANRRKIVAFVGGLDLCDGRYDTPQHPLFRTLQTIHKDDFHNPTFTGNLSGCPREPWHDLHSKIDGPAAYDVLTNFEERWLKAAKPSGIKKFKTSYDDALLRIDRIPDIVGVSDTPTISENDPEAWHVQIFRSIDSNSVKGFPKDPKDATCKNLVCGNATTVRDAVSVSLETVKVDVSSKTGVKRARTISEENQSSVHVTYKHLTRASKQKLESLLQQWSEWEAEQSYLPCQSDQDQEPALESGEDTYFPALRVGLQKTSSVSFWFDCKTGQDSLKEFVPVESSTTPLYNRQFAIGLDSTVGSSNLEGGLEIIDDDPPRCFNCGAYSHSMRECPKPFDRSAVNIARRQHKSKRNQSSRLIPSRYYKSAQGGKYDGLKPGSLDPETRQVLGLGELDPPPWLHRMREIGYPPGYLAVEEDHLSGITIFDEEETEPEEEEKEEGEVKAEDGEILEVAASSSEPPQMKMTVEFPGINAPIPENADVWLWQQRKNTGHGYNHDHQYRGVMGPPGVELSSSYPPRYGGIRYDHGFGSIARSPGSESERRYYYSPYDQNLR